MKEMKASTLPRNDLWACGALVLVLAFSGAAEVGAQKPRGGTAVRKPDVAAKSVPRAAPPASRQPRVAVPRDQGGDATRGVTRHRPRSGRRIGGRVGFHFGYYGHYGHYYRPYWPYLGYYYYPYPYYWGPGYYRGGALGLGALDLNVKPKRADVYVDGELIGRAGQFDGFPDYLWLEEGSYELIFYHPGYETVVRQLTVRPGVKIKVRFQLDEGESIPAAELSTVEARPRRRPAAGRYGEPVRPEPRYVEPPAPAEPQRPAEETMDLRVEPGRFRLDVEPADASIYLDGRFLGTAEELARLHAGLIVDPGDHQLEVVRPGYISKTMDFSVSAGSETEVKVRLAPAAEAGVAAGGDPLSAPASSSAPS